MLRDKRVLVVVVLVLGAGLVAGATLTISAFTASTSGGGSISAGALAFALAPTGRIVDTSAMKPGDTKSGTVTLTNQKAAATFTLTFTGLGTSTLPGVLQLTVLQTSPTTSKQLYSGALAAVPPLNLGQLATGDALTLQLTFVWPSGSSDPSLQGQRVDLVLQWDGRT